MQHFEQRPFDRKSNSIYIVSDSERSGHCMLIIVLPTLAALVRDIINPTGSLFPLPSLSSSALGLFPLSLSLHPVTPLLAHSVGFVRCQSEHVIGNCQINFFLDKPRSAKIFKILTESCLY